MLVISMQKNGLLLISLLLSGMPLAYAEDYFYIPNHKLETPPTFCAMEFDDSKLPNAQKQLLEITKNAISDWETKLVEATNNPKGWDFKFQTFSVAEQQEPFYDVDCTVNIYYERQPPKGEWDYLGYADSYLTFSDIRIFYLEPIYEYNGEFIEINGETWEVPEVTGFKNNLTLELDDTIRHEIGHSLGLDHPKLESYQFVRESPTVWRSPSIMIDEYEYQITGDIHYEITDYDIRSVVNLYGEDGINETNFMAYLDFIIIGIVLIVIIYFVKRKYRKTESELIPLDNETESIRCNNCNRLLSSKSESGLCHSCSIEKNS